MITSLILSTALTVSVGQPEPPIVALPDGTQSLTILMDGNVETDDWLLNSSLDPDQLSFLLAEGASTEVCFVATESSEDPIFCQSMSSAQAFDFTFIADGVEYPHRLQPVRPDLIWTMSIAEEQDQVLLDLPGLATMPVSLASHERINGLSMQLGELTICFELSGDRQCREFDEGGSLLIEINHGDRKTRFTVPIADASATFSETYIAENRGRIAVEVPEFYEMMNVLIALTDTVQDHEPMGWGFIDKRTDYYTQVMERFGEFRDHAAVAVADRYMAADQYFNLKVNSYTFNATPRGEIQPSPTYGQIWGRPELDGNTIVGQNIEAFADFYHDTSFRQFYTSQAPYYHSVIEDFEVNLDLPGMIDWLSREFPDQSAYDGYKVIVSPLAYSAQNSSRVVTEDYAELQAHMNVIRPAGRALEFSEGAIDIHRGYLTFTELNHGYINPAAGSFAQQILEAVGQDHTIFNTSGYYGSAQSTFLEMLNWGLVILYYDDHMDAEDFELGRYMIATTMVEGRGFIHFEDYAEELLRLYRGKAADQTVADLYPDIIAWFASKRAQLDAETTR